MADKRIKWQEVSMPRLISPAGSQAAHWNYCQPPYLSTGLILPNRRGDLWATHGCLSWARTHLPLDLLSGRSVSVWQPCQALLTVGIALFCIIMPKTFPSQEHFPGDGDVTLSLMGWTPKSQAEWQVEQPQDSQLWAPWPPYQSLLPLIPATGWEIIT